MQVQPNEIAEISEIGTLNQLPVKLVRLKGGLFLAIGRLKGKLTEESLGAGSHSAIVKFNLERQYPDYQPNMMKSESMSQEPKVDKHSHFLSDELRKSGHDIYSIQLGNKIEFQITKDNEKISSVNSAIDKGTLVIGDMKIDKGFAKSLAGAASEKALSCSIKTVRLQDK